MKPAVKWGIAAASGAAVFLALRKMKKANEEQNANIANNLQLIASEVQQQVAENKNLVNVSTQLYKNENITKVINNLIANGQPVGGIFAFENDKKYLPGANYIFYIQYASNPQNTNNVALQAFNTAAYGTFRAVFSRINLPSNELSWK